MPDTTDSLLHERTMLKKELADWWKRWRALDPNDEMGKRLMDIDTWAKETPEENAERTGRA